MKLLTLALLTIVAGCGIMEETSRRETGGDHDCGGGSATAEVNVIGVYTPTTGNAVHVAIDRPGEQVLVLSAYEQTSWVVDVADGAHVAQVFAVGYDAQDVVVNQDGDAADIETSFYPAGEIECGYSWPYNGEGCDTVALLDYAARVTDSDVTSFHGCYQANDWTLNADLSVDSDCDTASGYEVDGFVIP